MLKAAYSLNFENTGITLVTFLMQTDECIIEIRIFNLGQVIS